MQGDKTNGLEIDFDDAQLKERDLDEYTREILPRQRVKAAMTEELSYFNDHVWEASTMGHAKTDPDAKMVRSC